MSFGAVGMRGRLMNKSARYSHTNLVALDWRALARFYEEVFGCVQVPPERDFSGPELEAGTGVPGARLTGVHLRLPGCGENGPTLEIFNYSILKERPPTAVNRPGFGHIAFVVDDVAGAREEVLAAGGSAVGEIVTLDVDGPKVTWCYVTDPEGNVIELQSWSEC
jgi:predicted enzyme related to lactoylglutathione lyase